MLELLYRVRRIEFQTEMEVKLGDKFCFSSSHRASRPSAQIPVLHKLPTDEEIEESIGKAKECALLRAKTLGMHYSSIPDLSFNLRSFNIEIEDEFEGLVTVVDDLNIENQDFQEDICIISSGALGVKTFEQVSLSPDSAFVKVSDGFENPAIIKKSTLMRLLSDGDCKVSSDRIYCFKTPANTTKQVKPSDLESMLFQAEDIFEDDWCVFSTSDQKSFLIGKILSFGYLSGGSKKELRYSKRSAPVKASNSRDGFHSIAYYVCTIPRPSITEGKFYTTRIVEGEVKSLFKKKVSRKSK
ncbi:hypothetical protein ONE63_011325 [Megalurothrips usitatus]|uniref:Uncharacterized protein n=1 Tax=Megalurothrips usitatus TaxID=439358 RepID=A0AAV7X3U0_9NEOP|nr:hypothetical protein ONE63_011325 [Megalurothrips usitatus]